MSCQADCEDAKDVLDELQKNRLYLLFIERQCAEHVKVLKDNEVKISQQQDEMRNTIDAHCERVINIIRQHQAKLHSKVNTVADEDMRQVKTKMAELSLFQNQIEGSLALASSVSHSRSKAEVKRVAQQIYDQNKLLKEKDALKHHPVSPRSFKFIPNDKFIKGVTDDMTSPLGILELGLTGKESPESTVQLPVTPSIESDTPCSVTPSTITPNTLPCNPTHSCHQQPATTVSQGDKAQPNVGPGKQEMCTIRPKATIVQEFNARSKSDANDPWIAGVAIAKDSTMLVTDFNNHKIKVFKKSGNLIYEWSGDGGHHLDHPWDISCGQDGNIAVASTGNDSLFILDSTFQVKKSLVAPKCRGVVWLSQNELAFVGDSTKAVTLVNINGAKLKTIAIDSQGNQLFDHPWFLTKTRKNVIVVSDNGKYCMCGLTLEGDVVFRYGRKGSGEGEEMSEPRGVCVDKLGNIMVADWVTHRVHLVSPDGKFIRDLVTKDDGLQYPRGIEVDSDGHLVVTECKGKIQIFKYRD
ncbi:uncharacterized protein LOC106176753 [Lingula anatina]|uniref:Uncharacterized protein LOC106176753 n=1 Tax=Lingula anatina TaxID=7574 RepID=A0A1S3JWF5_LINAN|nr:uncharacterized protein LOC106176753 [Lingula anatina]|eukprot:XP_013414760.1 uncharacterized protein LOC106176753 [Lingula anatina]